MDFKKNPAYKSINTNTTLTLPQEKMITTHPQGAQTQSSISDRIARALHLLM